LFFTIVAASRQAALNSAVPERDKQEVALQVVHTQLARRPGHAARIIAALARCSSIVLAGLQQQLAYMTSDAV
jgi:hypothetical protein